MINELIKKITDLKQPDVTLIVAIDGRGGSGKSTLANNLKEKLENVSIIHLDDFAYPMGGADRQRLLDQVILPLKDNKEAKYQERDFKTKELTDWYEIQPGGIVIIEGVITLHDLLEKYYDFKIWIEVSAEIGFQRGLKRDKEEYGIDTEKDWKDNWLPEEEKAIEEQQPMKKADFIVDGIKDNLPESDYAEFNDPRLVAIYNTVCALGDEKQFYIKLAKDLSVKIIVDLGSGTGLLTIDLANLGYQMIGVEPSNLMLEVARKNSEGLNIEWIQGDAKSLTEFNADLVIMTGHVAQFHLDDESWQKALASIYKALKSGGYLAFESRNPAVQPWNKKDQEGNTDWYAPNFHRTFHDPVAGEIDYRSKLLKVDGEFVLSEGHYTFTKNGEELVSRNELRFRTREEITKSLEKAGFNVEKVYGNWDGSIATDESPEMIFVAKK